MSHTRDKMSEAVYFLDRMIEYQENENSFTYNLSAFLAAFRSVTFVMQEEFHRSQGFCDWYENQRNLMKADTRMGLLDKKRVMTINQEPVRATKDTNVHITVTVPNPTFSIVVTDPEGTVKQKYTSALQDSSNNRILVTHRWFFQEIPDTDILTICNECPKMLSAMVSECEEKFSPAG